MENEVYEALEWQIEDLVAEYEKYHPRDCYQEYFKRGAIEALNKALALVRD